MRAAGDGTAVGALAFLALVGLAVALCASAASADPESSDQVQSTPTPASREDKLIGLQERIEEWLAAGGDPNAVLPLGQKLDELFDQGTPAEIDAQIDRIRAVVATPPSPARRPTAPADTAPVPINVRPIPAGAAIVFFSARSGLGSEIYTMNADGGEVTQITFISPRPFDQPYEHVAVSPDHRMIAADRYLKSGSGPTGLWVIDLERKTERHLVPDFFSAGNGGVDWSADGSIYFAGQRAVRQKAGVFRIRPDGSQLTPVVALDPLDAGFVGDVSVSEDGSLLAYVRAVAARSATRMVLKTQIWVAQINGGEQRMVDDGGPELGSQGGFPIGDFDPEISPDNAFVVFSRTNTEHVSFKTTFNNGQDLWVAPVDRSAPARRLTQPGPISIVPDWHDRKIVYTEYSEVDGYAGLVLIEPDGSGRRRLETTTGTLRDGGRHGKWIASARVAPTPSP